MRTLFTVDLNGHLRAHNGAQRAACAFLCIPEANRMIAF